MAQGKNPDPRKPATPDAGVGAEARANGAATPSGSPTVPTGRNPEPTAGVKEPTGKVEPPSAGPDAIGEPVPRQLRINGFDTVDPGSLPNDRDGRDGGKRKRGRPPGRHGPYNKRHEPAAQAPPPDHLELKDLDSLIAIAHFTCARILEIPELELTQEESERLADATRKVAKHYAISLDPKRMALVELLFTAGGIYGPRVISYAKRTGAPKTRIPPLPVQPAGTGAAAPAPEPVPAQSTPPPEMPRRNGATVPSEIWQEETVDGSFI